MLQLRLCGRGGGNHPGALKRHLVRDLIRDIVHGRIIVGRSIPSRLLSSCRFARSSLCHAFPPALALRLARCLTRTHSILGVVQRRNHPRHTVWQRLKRPFSLKCPPRLLRTLGLGLRVSAARLEALNVESPPLRTGVVTCAPRPGRAIHCSKSGLGLKIHLRGLPCTVGGRRLLSILQLIQQRKSVALGLRSHLFQQLPLRLFCCEFCEDGTVFLAERLT
mmetsp:Transcript_5491/g.15754  ORF Transcript_5491/g.15754 Transcript_5491/m.15754 type:complete len:221 (-) Transcript_5491:249-911(-)